MIGERVTLPHRGIAVAQVILVVSSSRRFTSPRGRKLTGLAKKYPRPVAPEADVAADLLRLDVTGARPHRVLVADGCTESAAGTAFVLARAGYRVSTAATPAETLNALARERFNLVLLGTTVGRESGMDVLRTIRTRAQPAELRTDPRAVSIVMTLECEQPRYEDARYTALAGGADDVLIRPFDARELLVRLMVLLRRGAANRNEPADILRLGALAIDFAGHRVEVDEKRIHLTRSEYTLLRALVERRGQLCSRAELNEVRSPKPRPSTSSSIGRGIDMQISRMRRKLGPAGQMIENVRGEGYRLR